MAVFKVAAARTLAASLLGNGDRWLHTQTAAAGATEAACTVAPQDEALLVAAAWLHDIGYLHPHPPLGITLSTALTSCRTGVASPACVPGGPPR